MDLFFCRPGEHVSDEDGTGFVHTAPSHGVEDFDACSVHGIIPVDLGERVYSSTFFPFSPPSFLHISVQQVVRKSSCCRLLTSVDD